MRPDAAPAHFPLAIRSEVPRLARRIARLVVLPAGLTLLCCAQVAPPRWLRPAAHVFQFRKAARPTPHTVVKLPALPRIVAIDSRIARRVNALRPGVKIRLLKAVAKLPTKVVLLITSAARTHAEQRALHGTF